MEMEIISNEIKRVIEEIEKFIQKKAKMVLLSGKIFFSQEIILKTENLCFKRISYSFNEIICSRKFSEATRKERIQCLTCYKEIFSKMIE